MRNIQFREVLTARQKAVNSLVCVGLDPLLEKLPPTLKEKCGDYDCDAVRQWMLDIVIKTAPFTSMFKPNRAYFEAIIGGEAVLDDLINFINNNFPDIPVFLDCKRGDIDRTQKQYRHAHFVNDGADGMNYNGYMGRSTLESLIDREYPGRALVGLGRTSNSEAWEVQDDVLRDGQRVWERMVQRIRNWSEQFGVLQNAGVVMGAAHQDPWQEKKIYSYHLFRARELVSNSLWFLIPGCGKQKGFVEETVENSFVGPGSIAVNSSSAITEASQGEDYADAAGLVAEKFRDEIRAAGGNCN